MTEAETRSPVTQETLTLISPVLLDAQRRWRFSVHGFEFGAVVKDHDFLERFLSGSVRVPMIAGITMDVVLETREEKVGDVWTVRERIIERVLDVHPVPRQTTLPFPTQPKDDQG